MKKNDRGKLDKKIYLSHPLTKQKISCSTPKLNSVPKEEEKSLKDKDEWAKTLGIKSYFHASLCVKQGWGAGKHVTLKEYMKAYKAIGGK